MSEKVKYAGAVGLKIQLDSSSLQKGFEEVKQKAKNVGSKISSDFKEAGSSLVKSFEEAKGDTTKNLTDLSKRNSKTVEEIQNEAPKIADTYKKQGDAVSKAMKRAYEDVEKETEETTEKVKKSTSKIPESVEKSCSKMRESFSNVGKMIKAAFSVAVIKSFVQESIEATAEVQAANSQFEQTFGEMSNQATAAIKTVADESNITQTRLQGVGTSIYAFAKTTGMDSADALLLMQDALQVTADSAAYYDRSLEDTAESLKSFLKGNYENDSALGLSCTETTRNTAANKLYGKSFKDLSESQKQLTLLEMVKDANKLSGALGQASRESDGWENVTGNLKDTWKQFLAEVGKPSLKIATSVVKKYTESLQKLIKEKKVSDFIEKFSNKIDKFSKIVKKVPLSHITGITGGVVGLVASLKTLQAVKQAKTRLLELSDSLKNLKKMITAHPYAVTFVALATAITAVVTAIKTYNQQKWNESALKKQIDNINEYSEEIKECADTLRETREEFENTELELKADFSQVDGFKSRLQELIEDATIDESEMAEYKTIVDFLSEKVEGFEAYWDGLELEEVNGKIQLNPDVETVTSDIDAVIDKWKELQASQMYSSQISAFGTNKVKYAVDVDVAEKNVKDARKALDDFLSERNLGVLGNDMYEILGVDAFVEEYQKGHLLDVATDVTLGSKGKDLMESYINATDSLSSYTYEMQENNRAYDEAWNKQEALNGSKTNYAGILGLVEDGIYSEQEALKQLEGTGINTMAQLETRAAAQKAKEEALNSVIADTSESYSDMSETAQESAQEVSEATDDLAKNSKKNIYAIETGYNSAFYNIGAKAKELWYRLKSIFSNNVHIGESLRSIFKGALNYLIDGINGMMINVVSFINDKFATIRDWRILGKTPFSWLPEFTAPQIPYLAKGGIVKAPTLAVVGDNPGAGSGDPEVVSPLSKLQSMINTSSGQDAAILLQILDYLKRIYEMFVVFKNNGGNMFEFIATLDDEVIFKKMIKQNELYKKRHNGESAF